MPVLDGKGGINQPFREILLKRKTKKEKIKVVESDVHGTERKKGILQPTTVRLGRKKASFFWVRWSWFKKRKAKKAQREGISTWSSVGGARQRRQEDWRQQFILHDQASRKGVKRGRDRVPHIALSKGKRGVSGKIRRF